MDGRGISEIILAIGVIVGIVFKYLTDKRAKGRLIEEKTKLKSDILQLLEQAKTTPESDDTKTFIDRVKADSYIEKIICALHKNLGAELVALFVASDYKEGIGLESYPANKLDSVVITHECKNDNIGSQKDSIKKVFVWQMISIIDKIENSENKALIVNSIKEFDPIKDAELLTIIEASGNKSVMDYGVYRPEDGHRSSYMIGAIVVGYITKKHKFTDEDTSLTEKARNEIAVLLEDEWIEFKKK